MDRKEKNWFVVKCISHDLDSKIEIEYTKGWIFQLNLKMKYSHKKVPEGVKSRKY